MSSPRGGLVAAPAMGNLLVGAVSVACLAK